MVNKKTLIFNVKGKNGEELEDKVELTLTCVKEHANYVVHRGLVTQLNNKRQGTASTKTRSDVRGGGRKPWRQKGTGRARAGSTRSPIWRGGGVSFGPKPKIYYNKINKKEFKLALNSLLYNRRDEILVVDNLNLSSTKTKDFVKQLKIWNLPQGKKILLVVDKKNVNIYLATKNIPNIELILSNQLNLVSILNSERIIFTRSTLPIIREIYNYE